MQNDIKRGKSNYKEFQMNNKFIVIKSNPKFFYKNFFNAFKWESFAKNIFLR